MWEDDVKEGTLTKLLIRFPLTRSRPLLCYVYSSGWWQSHRLKYLFNQSYRSRDAAHPLDEPVNSALRSEDIDLTEPRLRSFRSSVAPAIYGAWRSGASMPLY